MEKYEKPSVTVDLVIFTVKDNQLMVLLIKRNLAPFKESWALPGGFVRINESLREAAMRELEEETGIKDVYLEQLYTFGKPKRDPRGRIITVVYYTLVNSENIALKATTDASEAEWFPLSKLPELAFDHKGILDYALTRLKWKFEYTTIGLSFLPKKFTMTQLQDLYEIIFKKKFDKRNFRKKVISLNILKEQEVKKDVSHRPPQLYSLKPNIPKVVEII